MYNYLYEPYHTKVDVPVSDGSVNFHSHPAEYYPVAHSVSSIGNPNDTYQLKLERISAVMVGINYRGSASELKGCYADTQAMSDVILRSGFPVSRIEYYNEEDRRAKPPTKANIIAAFKGLIANSQPGDILFFHYSGHGSQMPCPTGDEHSGFDQVWVPSDYQSNGCILDDWLHDYIQAVPADRMLVVVSDSCHSGSMLDIEGEVDRSTHGPVVEISGCLDGETSADTVIGGRAGGAMTNGLIRVIDMIGGFRNFIAKITEHNGRQEIQQLLRQKLAEGRYTQHPQISYEGSDGSSIHGRLPRPRSIMLDGSSTASVGSVPDTAIIRPPEEMLVNLGLTETPTTLAKSKSTKSRTSVQSRVSQAFAPVSSESGSAPVAYLPSRTTSLRRLSEESADSFTEKSRCTIS